MIVHFFRGQQGVLDTVAAEMPARDYCIVSMQQSNLRLQMPLWATH